MKKYLYNLTHLFLNYVNKIIQNAGEKLPYLAKSFSPTVYLIVEINYQKKKTVKQHKHMEGKQYASKEPWITEEVKEEIGRAHV